MVTHVVMPVCFFILMGTKFTCTKALVCTHRRTEPCTSITSIIKFKFAFLDRISYRFILWSLQFSTTSTRQPVIHLSPDVFSLGPKLRNITWPVSRYFHSGSYRLLLLSLEQWSDLHLDTTIYYIYIHANPCSTITKKCCRDQSVSFISFSMHFNLWADKEFLQ